MTENSKKNTDKTKYLLCYFLFFLFCTLIWAIVYYKLVAVEVTGDYFDHNRFAQWMMEGEFETTYPGYQLLVGIPYLLTGIKIEYISVAVLTVFALFTVYVTDVLIRNLLKDINPDKIQTLILSFLLNIIQPVFTYSIRPGYSSGNGYISPTHAVCKPFIILVFLYTYRMFADRKYDIKNQILLFASLLMSCIIKPVFAMAYVPAMGILYLTDELSQSSDIREKIKSYILKIWPLFFTGIVLILQYALSFNLKMPPDTGYSLSEGAGIKIGFLVAWKSVVSSVSLSLVFAYFFPIVLLITGLLYKRKSGEKLISSCENNFLKISFFYGAVSLLYMSLLYQENHVEDCNFRNAWIVTFSVIYILCISVLYRNTRERKLSRALTIINWGAFSVHILMGIALYIKNIM